MVTKYDPTKFVGGSLAVNGVNGMGTQNDPYKIAGNKFWFEDDGDLRTMDSHGLDGFMSNKAYAANGYYTFDDRNNQKMMQSIREARYTPTTVNTEQGVLRNHQYPTQQPAATTKTMPYSTDYINDWLSKNPNTTGATAQERVNQFYQAHQTPTQPQNELYDIAKSTPQYNRTNTYSTPQNIGNIAQQNRQQMEPMVQGNIRQSQQQYADLGRQIKEAAANMGMLRSGGAIDNLMDNSRDAVNNVSNIQNNAMNTAYQQALPMAQFGMQEQQYNDQLRNQQYQQMFNNLMGYNQFDLSKALQEADLTGQYGGQSTLAAQQLAAMLQQQQFQNEMTKYQSALDYLNNMAQQTGNWMNPDGYYPGDILTDWFNKYY